MGSLSRELDRKELKKTYKAHKAAFMVKRRFHEMLIEQGLNPPEGERSYAKMKYPSYKDWLKLYKPWLKQEQKQQPEQQLQLELPADDLSWEEEEQEKKP